MPCKGVEPLRLHVPLFFPQMGGCYQSGEYPVDINEDSHDGMDDHTAYNCHVLSQYGAHPELAVSMSYDMPWGFGVPFCETAPCYIM